MVIVDDFTGHSSSSSSSSIPGDGDLTGGSRSDGDEGSVIEP